MPAIQGRSPYQPAHWINFVAGERFDVPFGIRISDRVEVDVDLKGKPLSGPPHLAFKQ